MESQSSKQEFKLLKEKQRIMLLHIEQSRMDFEEVKQQNTAMVEILSLVIKLKDQDIETNNICEAMKSIAVSIRVGGDKITLDEEIRAIIKSADIGKINNNYEETADVEGIKPQEG